MPTIRCSWDFPLTTQEKKDLLLLTYREEGVLIDGQAEEADKRASEVQSRLQLLQAEMELITKERDALQASLASAQQQLASCCSVGRPEEEASHTGSSEEGSARDVVTNGDKDGLLESLREENRALREENRSLREENRAQQDYTKNLKEVQQKYWARRVKGSMQQKAAQHKEITATVRRILHEEPHLVGRLALTNA
mmetsp:Transcript_30096/g.70166  ORF Transcript_30096/g.70166 Transcript_30096/m.70166 type:complete len:196 (-) Transcript_30096:139-726(-)